MHPQIALIQDAVVTEGRENTIVHTAVCYLVQEFCIWLSLLRHIRIIFITHTSSEQNAVFEGKISLIEAPPAGLGAGGIHEH